MEQQEASASAGRLAMSLIEPVDAGRGRRQEVVVARDMLGRGVEPVGQEGEAQIALAIGQVVDLQAVDLGLGVGFAREQHRHHDERP